MQTLNSVVNDYIAQSGKSKNKYLPYLNYAISIMKELHYDVDGVNKVHELTLENTNVSYLPNDIVKLVRVYMAGSNGFIQEIFEDNGLNPRGKDNCGDDTRLGAGGPNVGIDQSYYTAESVTEHVRDGEFVGREYGGGGGGIYTYRYNREQSRLEFSSNVEGPLYLEYLGSKERIDGKFYISELAVEAVLTGIRYRELRFKNRVAQVQIADARNAYSAASQHYRVRMASRSIGEMINAKRKTMKQSPKY